nr:MAG TPA: hypothetical protein [Caudoviricetes sp.]
MARWWRWSVTVCLTRICLSLLSILTIPLRFSRTSRLRLKLVVHHSYRQRQNSHQLSWKKCRQQKKGSYCRRMMPRHDQRAALVIATATVTGACNV